MKKDVKERLSEQVKKLSREELEKKYLNLLFKTFDNKKNARLNGVLGSMISTNKKKKLAKSESRKEQYQQQLEHPMWVKKREVILKRDNYQCRICGSKHNLQVHHIKYSIDKKAWEYPNLDLITLCEECHKKVHADKNHDLNPYKEIWYNINGFSDYEATEYGRLRLKASKKRIQWAHLGTQEHYVDSDGNETQFTHITNDKGLVVWISKEKLLKLLNFS